jgi:hypothetical protein
MRTRFKAALILGCLPWLFAGMASGGEGIEVKITNDGTEDILVTVYDTNTRPRRVVLANERINGFSSVPVTLEEDATGMANLSWTAISVDATSRRCGQGSTVAKSADTVNVHTDSSCGS